MIGAGSTTAPPAAALHSGKGIGDDLLRRPAGALHFADRLLWEDRRNPTTGGFHRGDMPRRRQADAVAETKTRLQTQNGKSLDTHHQNLFAIKRKEGKPQSTQRPRRDAC